MDIKVDIECNAAENFRQEVLSDKRRDYGATYSEEVTLNTTFKEFASNYKASYEGRNTRRDQVDNKKVSKTES